ncbi:MAG TPA: M15 family metallopeptidase [Acidimicrobiia bacterium]
MRRSLQLVTLLIGVVVGYAIAVAATPGVVAPSVTPEPGDRHASASTTTTSAAISTSTTTELSQPETYLVWSTGGLTSELVEGLAERFDDFSVVRGDTVELDTDDDLVIPLDGLALDPETHRSFDPRRSLVGLRPGTVALGATSAMFRGLEAGDALSISNRTYQVAAVAPDEVVGAAEVIFSAADENAPAVTDRYALVHSELERNEFESIVRDMYDGPAPLRIRSEDETPWMRHGDAVLPQIFIKTALGEFAYGSRSGSKFSQDPAYVEANIIEGEVPILGAVTCHEKIVEMLRGAMTELVDDGLAHLVDPAGFAGCWNPRYIRATTGRSAGISRHAWGAALDLNAASNPVGSAGTQDPRLVAVMGDWGFTWGGDWLVPDPMHFEYGVVP